MTQTDSFLESLRRNWFLIIACISTVGYAIRLQSTVDSLNQRMDDQVKMLIDFGNSGAAIKRDIGDVKATMGAQGQELKDIREFIIRK